MLQRIQTIWLLFASVCVFLTLKFSTYSGTTKDLIPSAFLTGTSTIPLIMVTLAVGIVSLITIFLYKNRKLQLRLTLLSILLEALLIFLYYNQIKTFTGGAISITALFHLGVIVFLILAARGISSDEKLIKDSNRLR
jgi:peptidoglycan/LPS O-acetylase OafA/YrhL